MKKKTELTIEQQAHRTRLRDLYCGVFVVTVFVWVCRFALGGLAGLAAGYLNYYAGTALQIFANSLAVFLPFFVFLKVMRDPIGPVFRENPADRPVVRCLLGILAVGGLTLGIMGLMYWLLSFLEGVGVHSAITVPNLGDNWLQTVYYALLSTLLYSFTYEVAFRGIALKTMTEENRLAAVTVSSLAFAFSDGDPYTVAVRLVLGFVLGWFYLRVKSVWLCMVLQATSQFTVTLWWILVRSQVFTAYINFLIVLGLVFGVAAAFFLFYPRLPSREEKTPDKFAVKQILTSFGVYLLVVLMVFNMLVFTFSTDGDPADPLLQPTPEEGQKDPLHFDRDGEFEDEYGTLNPHINE